MSRSRILFMNVDYAAFLDEHYRKNSGLVVESYATQMRSILAEGFGDSDHWVQGMRKAGWDADVIILNNSRGQTKWYQENAQNVGPLSSAEMTLVYQIQKYKPDVIFAMGIWTVTASLREWAHKMGVKIVAGHVGSLLENFKTDLYDIIFTPIPGYVQEFRKVGVNAEYLALAFAPRLLNEQPDVSRDWYPVSFIGGITGNHSKRLEMLNAIGNAGIKIDAWGPQQLQEIPNVKYHGEAWGREVIDIYQRSLITLNCHIDHAFPYVGNMRMFEATGAGAMLITDHGDNVYDLFNDGEIAVYTSPKYAPMAVDYYLKNPQMASANAKKGQERTLRDHTYDKRMEEVDRVLRRLL